MSNPQKVVDNFAYDAGGWRLEKHPRFLADLTADRRDDIIGFGDAGVWVSLNNGNGTFWDCRGSRVSAAAVLARPPTVATVRPDFDQPEPARS